MKDKDKEAFEKWFLDNYKYKYTELVILEAIEQHRTAWQGACEYKQKEIDELNDLVFAIETNNKSMEEQIEYLQAENAKLRECVIKVAYSYDRPTDMINNARKVLKELEGKCT